jgi:hypothetical protein
MKMYLRVDKVNPTEDGSVRVDVGPVVPVLNVGSVLDGLTLCKYEDGRPALVWDADYDYGHCSCCSSGPEYSAVLYEYTTDDPGKAASIEKRPPWTGLRSSSSRLDRHFFLCYTGYNRKGVLNMNAKFDNDPIPFDDIKEELMSKEIQKAPSWVLANPIPTDLEPPTTKSEKFPYPLPRIKMNTKDAKGRKSPYLVTSEADDAENLLVAGEELKNVSSLMVVPIWAYRRHMYWNNGMPEFEHPTQFGPFPETGDKGKNELRFIFYAPDYDSFYYMDISAISSKEELYAFAYYRIWQAVADGTDPTTNVYEMFTHLKEGKYGPYYSLRFRRTEDVLSPHHPPDLATDSAGEPDYLSGPLTGYTKPDNAGFGKAAALTLSNHLGSGKSTAVQAAVHLLGCSGITAAKAIRKIQKGEMSYDEALLIPQGRDESSDDASVEDPSKAVEFLS